MNTGITTNKNALGCDCLILGFFLFWHLLQIWRTERSTARRKELLLIVGFLIAIWWLFSMARSSTALISLLLGVFTMTLLGLRFVNKRLVGTYVVAGIVIYVLAEATFGISSRVIEFLGKNPTLTDRTALWNELLAFKINPIFGTGFESFWLGERREALWEAHWWRPNEAHNGYLETYLNLGLTGLLVLIALIIATYRKARLELFRNFQFGRLRLGVLAMVVAYNWTETTFKNISPLWFIFYIIALDYRQPEFDFVERYEAIRTDEDSEIVYAPGEI
jgi:O-antigen ligase